MRFLPARYLFVVPALAATLFSLHISIKLSSSDSSGGVGGGSGGVIPHSNDAPILPATTLRISPKNDRSSAPLRIVSSPSSKGGAELTSEAAETNNIVDPLTKISRRGRGNNERMCLLLDHTAPSLEQSIRAKMGAEYLPPGKLRPCSNLIVQRRSKERDRDPGWAKADCPGLAGGVHRALARWAEPTDSPQPPPQPNNSSSTRPNIGGTVHARTTASGGISDGQEMEMVQLGEYGFFSMVHSMVNPTMEIASRGNAVKFAPLERWTADGRSFEGWLLPPPPSPPPPPIHAPPVHPEQQSGEGGTATGGKFGFQLCDGTMDGKTSPLSRFVAVSHVMSTFLRHPVPSISTAVSARMVRLNWDPATDAVLGLYIRRGDSCSDAQVQAKRRTCDDLAYYMDDVRRVVDLYGIRRIYLLSDGGDYIYNQTRQFPQYEWLFERMPPKTEEENIEARLDRVGGGLGEGTDMLIDFYTLTSAQVLVGKFTSNVFRAAVEYASGVRGERVPYVSLDAPWCLCFKCVSTVVRGKFKGYRFIC